MPDFIPGLELSRLYYAEAVAPILRAGFPGLVHSAALLGPGSEVLGFDTEMSTDHDWGPRVILFLMDEDHARWAGSVRGALGDRLPFVFGGYPTHFEPVSEEPRTGVLQRAGARPIRHRVQIVTLADFTLMHLGVVADRELAVLDWLVIPEAQLCGMVAGAVFHDGLNALEPLRRRLAYYPRDVWLYLLSAQWQRISQEEPFVGRAGVAGDETGSALIAARLARDVMRLCFLMARQYAPYSKWFGSAFGRLECAPALSPILDAALQATTWQAREAHLGAAYEQLAAWHNRLGITAPVPERLSRYYERPFQVIHGDAVARAIWEAISDEQVRALPFGVGKVDQFLDSTDVLSNAERCRRLAALYIGESPATG